MNNSDDISPVRAIARLRVLDCAGGGPGNGIGLDLSPLTGMSLTTLDIGYTKTFDLSPLRGMPLTKLYCGRTLVSDLSPLKGMKLTNIDCGFTRVVDLSPLQGMPLIYFSCYTTSVSDLMPLKGMKLTILGCGNTAVSDLSPLQGMPLTHLDCQNTTVSDLSPLKGMPLKILSLNGTAVADGVRQPSGFQVRCTGTDAGGSVLCIAGGRGRLHKGDLKRLSCVCRAGELLAERVFLRVVGYCVTASCRFCRCFRTRTAAVCHSHLLAVLPAIRDSSLCDFIPSHS